LPAPRSKRVSEQEIVHRTDPFPIAMPQLPGCVAATPSAAAAESSPGHATTDPVDPPPQRPTEPDATECCGEGCVRCVFDVYEAALERYETALAAWRARQP
jgi:hypothetical protein